MATAKTTDTKTTADVAAETTSNASSVVTPDVAAVPETSYTKEQIIESKRYSEYIDILNTVLGNRKYTFTEVDGLLEEFLTKEVE